PVRRDCDPLARMLLQVWLAVAVEQVVVSLHHPPGQLLEPRIVLGHAFLDQPPALPAVLLAGDPLPLLLDAHRSSSAWSRDVGYFVPIVRTTPPGCWARHIRRFRAGGCEPSDGAAMRPGS